MPMIMTQIMGRAVVVAPELAIRCRGQRLGDAEDGGGCAGDVPGLRGGERAGVSDWPGSCRS
jgi:hypothetical protein